jgi:hypothetical protein
MNMGNEAKQEKVALVNDNEKTNFNFINGTGSS